MDGKYLCLSRKVSLYGMAAFLLLNMGCYHKKVPSADERRAMPGLRKVVVVGFRCAMRPGDRPDVVRDPISGRVFMSEPVSDVVAQRMTDILFNRLVEDNRFQLVSPGQATGVSSKIVASDQNVGMAPGRLYQEIGATFGADAVLAGCIYRWREREGGDYAASRPASVAFNLHLIRPSDGVILWKSAFDKTQKSLSENLFEFSTFMQSGGRWLQAEKLAMIGLDKLLSEMPGAPVKMQKKQRKSSRR